MGGDYSQRPTVKRFGFKKTRNNRVVRKAYVVRRGASPKRKMRPNRPMRKRGQ